MKSKDLKAGYNVAWVASSKYSAVYWTFTICMSENKAAKNKLCLVGMLCYLVKNVNYLITWSRQEWISGLCNTAFSQLYQGKQRTLELKIISIAKLWSAAKNQNVLFIFISSLIGEESHNSFLWVLLILQSYNFLPRLSPHLASHGTD